jgi:hypothetical protein
MKKQDKDFFESLGVKFNGGIGEKYNIFALEQGILIAEALETKDKIIEFKDLDFDEQKKLVPGLSDEHSGNTFGLALRSAIAYLPQLLVNKRDDKIETIIKF